MQDKRAIIFDLDGTLLDTIADIGLSMNAVLLHSGFPVHDLKAYLSFVGEGMDVLACRALPEASRDHETVSRVVASMKQEYARRWADNSRPYPGIPELLDALTEKGLLLAVLSNKLDSFTKIMVRDLLGAWDFFRVVGLEFDSPRKPDPAQALKIAGDMHLDPGRIFFVGDSGTDMETAIRAGMIPVGVTWGYQGRESLISSGAAILLDRPEDLLVYL